MRCGLIAALVVALAALAGTGCAVTPAYGG